MKRAKESYISKDLDKRIKSLANLMQGNKKNNRLREEIKEELLAKYGKEYFEPKLEIKVKSDKIKNKQGYMLILLEPNNPYSSMIKNFTKKPAIKGYILEHRYIMARHLGKCLEPWEIVHHKNGVKDDNRIENLEIMTGYEHENRHLHLLCLENRILKGEIKKLKKRINLDLNNLGVFNSE